MGYAFIFPAYLILALVLLVPILFLLRMSFQGDLGEFVGFRNYIRLFQEPLFWIVFRNTILWVVISWVIQFLLGLGASLLLNQNIKGEKIFMSMLLFPWIASLVVSTVTWSWMLDCEYGLINNLLLASGLIDNKITWLSNPSTAIFVPIMVNAWHLFPFTMITLSAGLKAISPEIVDATKVDGANAWQSLIYITLPQLMALITVTSLYVVIWSFNAFTIPYLMTAGGPINSTTVMALYIHNLIFRDFNLTIASAMSIVMMVVVLTMSSVYLKAMRRMGGI